MEEEAYNVTAYCESAVNGSEPLCALYDTLYEVSEKVDGIESGVNSFFLLFGGALVFMMQAGFAMLCAGSVRQKNTKNIMLKNLLDACGGAIGFYTIGFGLAYGNGDQVGTTFVGTANFGLKDYDNYGFFFFQFAFAATAATIVAGTVAERCKMQAYLCYSFFLSAFVYPVVAHSIWDNNGFLSAFAAQEDLFRGVGVIDFAGSGVVHFTGGLTALIAAIVLGPRRGRFYDDDGNPLAEPVNFPPHSVSLQILGTFILWVGWYGFNPASALAIANPTSAQVATLAAVTTTMGAASGCIVCMFTASYLEMKADGEVSYDLTMAMNGCLSGLVAITAGCATCTPWAAILIGGVGGLVYICVSKLLVKFRIDDAVDAVPVHLGNGAWGIIATGLFSDPALMELAGYKTANFGWFYSWGAGTANANLLLAQFVGLLWIFAWVGTLMTPFFYILLKLNMFRVDPLEEEVGLDISHHKGSAYDYTEPYKDHVEQLHEVRMSKHGKVDIPDTNSATEVNYKDEC